MNKSIKNLTLLLFVFLAQSILHAQVQINSGIKYIVNLPQNSDWGVYNFSGTTIPQIQGKEQGNTCLKLPAPAVLNNASTQSGTTHFFKITPCGQTGCTANGGALSCILLQDCTQTQNAATAEMESLDRLMGRPFTPKPCNQKVGCTGSKDPQALLFAQSGSFVTSESIQGGILHENAYSAIDMSQYFPNSSGDYQIIYAVDLATGGALSGTDDF